MRHSSRGPVLHVRKGPEQDYTSTVHGLSAPYAHLVSHSAHYSDPDGHAHEHAIAHHRRWHEFSQQTVCVIVTVFGLLLAAGLVVAIAVDSPADDHPAVHVVIDPSPIVGPAPEPIDLFHTAEAVQIDNPSTPGGVCAPSEVPEHDRVSGHVTGRCRPTIRAPNGTHPDMVDWTVEPKSNFFRFASGRWIDAAPAGASRFFGVASENNEQIMKERMILATAETVNPTPVGSFVRSCMRQNSHFPADVRQARAADLASLASLAGHVRLLTTGSETEFDVMRAIAIWHQLGHITPVRFSATPSPLESGKLVLLFEPLEYAPLESIPADKQADFVNLLLADYDADGTAVMSSAQEHVPAVIAISNLLISRASTDFASVDLGEYVKRYYPTHAFSSAALRRQFPLLKWDSFFDAAATTSRLSEDDSREWINWSNKAESWVWDTEQLAIINAASRQFTIEQWKAYFLFLARIGMGDATSTLWVTATGAALVRSADSVRPSHHADEHIGLHKPSRQPAKPSRNHPRWATAPIAIDHAGLVDGARATSNVQDPYASETSYDGSSGSVFSSLEPHEIASQGSYDYCEKQARVYISSLVDDLFTQAVLSDAKRRQIRQVVVDTLAGLTRHVQTVQSFTATGRAALVRKFEATRILVGGPDYSGVRGGAPFASQTFALDYWENVLAARQAAMKHSLLRSVAPFAAWQDSCAFDMPANVANAYCAPHQQTISVLSGITTKPFDGNTEAPYSDASLFAGLGAIIGHEFWHLVDANGRMFDSGGSLLPWLPVADERVFVEYDGWIINTYAVPLPLTGEVARSRQQVGEAAADVMGLLAAFSALTARGTVTQDAAYEFFAFYAQMWANKETAESVHSRNAGDPHPLPEVRVNLAVRLLATWAKTYGKQLPPDRPRLLRV